VSLLQESETYGPPSKISGPKRKITHKAALEFISIKNSFFRDSKTCIYANSLKILIKIDLKINVMIFLLILIVAWALVAECILYENPSGASLDFHTWYRYLNRGLTVLFFSLFSVPLPLPWKFFCRRPE